MQALREVQCPSNSDRRRMQVLQRMGRHVHTDRRRMQVARGKGLTQVAPSTRQASLGSLLLRHGGKDTRVGMRGASIAMPTEWVALRFPLEVLGLTEILNPHVDDPLEVLRLTDILSPHVDVPPIGVDQSLPR